MASTDPTGYISIPLELIRGAAWKRPVACATTANITLSGTQTIDGHAATAGERVLVKNQTTGSQNGIYVVASGAWSRAFDMDQDLTTAVPAEEVLGAFVYVVAGTANGGKVFRATNTTTPTLGTTALTFTEFTSSSGTTLGWFNVTDYGAVHDGVTDDTVAIQAAINACHTAGGGTIYFPPGVYLIGGALVDTGTYNSQLEIPRATSGTWRNIRFLGAAPAVGVIGSASVLKSNWAGSISGNPSIISAGAHDSTSVNFTVLSFEDIVVTAPEDPKLTAIDATNALGLRWDNLTVNVVRAAVFTIPIPWIVPTHSNAVGVDMPYGSSSQPWDGGGALHVQGYYTGLRPSEQCAASLVDVAFCTRGIDFRGTVNSSPYWRHLCSIAHVAAYWNPRTIVFSGDQRWVNVGTLDIEHDSSPFTAVYDIDDASNYGRGFIGWHTTDFTTGPEDNLLVNGATGLSLFGAYAKRWKLNSILDIPTGTNPSTNPANGRRLYADSSTGHLSARDSSGTVIDYETAAALTVKDEGSALATAATSIDFVGAGVAATGTGAAKTVTIPGTPTGAAGGGLAGTYPNPTLVATAVRDAGRWEPVIDSDGSLVLDGATPPNVLMDWTS